MIDIRIKILKLPINILCRFLLILSILFLNHISYAQAKDADILNKLRLAQSFEDADEWDHAAAVYEELYKINPANFQIANGLQRSYTQLKEYDKAIGVVLKWLSFNPKDINFAIRLGGLYFESGNDRGADSVWDAALSANKNNVQVYRLAANEMMEHRLYDKCIRTYIEGRNISKSETQFADELGSIYAALQQYTSATKEFIRFAKFSPDRVPFVQSRLSTFTGRPEGLKSATEVLNSEIKSSPDNVPLHRLYAWLLMEDKKYGDALEQNQIIDRLLNANGNELFNFAQRLLQENVADVSAQAFKEVIDEHKNALFLPYARFGYARAIEELANQSFEKATPGSYGDAIKLYESIANEYVNADLTAQALYRIGVIKFEKLFDLDGALSAFDRIKKFPQRSGTWYEASLKIGDVQVSKNNLGDARKEFGELIRGPVVIYQNQAMFKLAELDYFEAGFDSALSLLKRFNNNLNTDLANDALQLQYFIQENYQSSPQALKEFADADLLMRRRNYSESLARFQAIVKNYPTALFIDDAMMKIAELYLHLQRPIEAISAYSFVIDSIRLSIFQDRAQFRIAEIYQNVVKNKDQAILAYERLLIKYPNSLYAEESRKRIRLLRGDAI